MAREQDYRLIDSVYRLHEDLYQLEDAVLRSAVGQFRLARIRTTSALAAAIATVLILVPIILTVTDLEWKDVPVVWSVVISLCLIALLG